MRSGEVASTTYADPLAEAKKIVEESPSNAYELFLQTSDVWSSFIRFMSAVQFLQKIPKEVRQKRAIAQLKVALLGNCTLSYMSDALSLALGPRIFSEIYSGDFDQWVMNLIDPESALAKFEPDIVVLYLSSLGLTSGGTMLVSPPADQIEDALRTFAARSRSPVITVLPEPLLECTGGNSDADRWYREAVQSISLAAKKGLAERAITLDPVPTLLSLKGEWAAPRYWNSAKVPLHPIACMALGRRLAQMIENITYPRTKVIAFDCDNTIWGGVVGEDGASALLLSPFNEGAGYLKLQRLLKEAASNGLILVALSKNEERNVVEAFQKRGEMILKTNDLSLLKVNWSPKSQNLLGAAQELNLGLDSFLLIDDSPFERGEIHAALPEVLIADLPNNPDEYASVINGLGVLERPVVSDEDARRTELYRQEHARQSARKSVVSPEEFLRDLQLEIVAMPIDANNLDRALQLISKTNQFNLTTRRHTRENLASLASDPDVYAYCYRVSDRFGDAGVTGICVAYRDGESSFQIDTLLLSCRVIGRTVENAILEHLRRWLVEKGVSQLYGEYLPTAKNGLVSNLLPRFDFTLISDTDNRKVYKYTHLDKPFTNSFAKIIEGNGEGDR